MNEVMQGVERLLDAAKQHRRGAVHTRDLGNPCADCGQPGPSTMTYCEKCMIARLADTIAALRQQVEALEAALDNIVAHYDALAGPRAHRVSCDCSGSNDGVHTCRGFTDAIDAARTLNREGNDE